LTRGQIKKAALSLFVKDGYEGAKLADIAKAVNIKTPSIYFHFESKEQIFTEVFNDMRDEKLANINLLHQKVNEYISAKERLFCLYSDWSNRGYEHNEEVIFWKRSALFPPSFLRDKIHNDLITYQNKFVDELLRPVIFEGVKSGELKNLDVNKFVVVFLSMIQGMFSEFHYSKPEAYREKIAVLWEFFWDSITK
jgi:AcrR family transcriptional regulator